VQQLAPLLVQAQFDMNSEAGRKIAEIWGTLVSRLVISCRAFCHSHVSLWGAMHCRDPFQSRKQMAP